MPKVAVIGGGAAGLSAARALDQSGAQVVLFEAGRTFGGRARSESVDGCTVDVGAQLFGSGFSALFEFAAATGGEQLLARSPGRDALWRKGRAHPITYGNIASMVTSSALPATLKLKLGARYVPFLLRHAQELNAGDPAAAGSDRLDRESVAEWGKRELGADFVELLAYPLLGAYYGSLPEATSVLLYHALARAGLDVSVYAVRGGSSVLFDTAAETLRNRGVQLRLNTAVSRVEEGAHHVAVDGASYDAAILAMPPHQVARLYQPDDRVSRWLHDVKFAASAVLALVLKQRVQVEYFGLSIPRTERGSDLVAICFQQQKLPGLVPADRSLLICLGAPSLNDDLLADPEAAVTRMIAAVEQIRPGTRELIAHAKLYRHHDGYPVFFPGYVQHLRAFPHDAQRRVVLAGDYLVSPTVEGAIRSGARSAQRVLDYLRAAG